MVTFNTGWSDAPLLDGRPIGVMADLHANALALSAVIADAEQLGVEQWIVLGDIVAMGPEPAAVLDRLAALPVLAFISGNTERYVLTGDRPFPSIADIQADPSLVPRLVEVAGVFAWTKGFLDATGHLDVLRSYLPSFRCILADGTRVLAVHASYVADDGPGIARDTPDDVLRQVFAGVDADLVLGGHTHDPTDRMLDTMRLVNPGSVGNPPTGDKSAKYCILDGALELTVTHRAVPYDIERVRTQIEESGYPGARYLLDRHYT